MNARLYVWDISDGSVKVGISNRPRQRSNCWNNDYGKRRGLRALRGYATPMILDAREAERAANRLLKSYRTLGPGERFAAPKGLAVSVILHVARQRCRRLLGNDYITFTNNGYDYLADNDVGLTD